YGCPRTGPDGAYSITVVAGNYRLGSSAEGYAQHDEGIAISANISNRDILLSQGFTVSGVVRDASTTNPISGADVWLHNPSTGIGYGGPRTGPDGAYSITVAAGNYKLGSSAEGYAQYYSSVAVSANVINRDILLSQGFTVSGVVRDASTTNPIPGADVWLHNVSTDIGYGGPRTGPDGAYSITVVAGNYRLGSRAEGYAQYNDGIVISANITNRDISLSQGYTVSGVVRDASTTNPISGADVWLYNPSTDMGYGGPRTGPDGAYSLTVAPGNYKLGSSAEGYAQYDEDITVSANITNRDVYLSEGFTVSGVVRDASTTNPISDAHVWLHNVSTDIGYGCPRTGPDGAYSITVVAGNYRLGSSAEGYAQYNGDITISANITNRDISLSQGFTVSGVVKDASTTNPISGAKVWLYDPSTDMGYGGPPTGPDGAYSITVAAGDYSLGARADGYAQYAEDITVSANISNREILLSEGFTVSGVVRDASTSNPIPEADVWLYNPSTGMGFGASPTGADGAYSLTVASGSYNLGARADGYAQYSEDITISANITNKDILLSEGFTVSGVVRDASTTNPIPGAKVGLFHFSTGIGYGTPPTGADGAYSITVAAGDYRLRAEADGYAQYSENITISANISNRDISLSEGFTVSGVVKDASTSYPISGAKVLLRNYSTEVAYGSPDTGADGVYSLSVPGGSYRLWTRVEGTSYAQYSENITISTDIINKDISLSEGFTVSGVIKDASTTNPISGAMVMLFNPVTGLVYTSKLTKGDGYYSITVVADDYNLMVEAAGYIQHSESINISADISNKDIGMVSSP
ncbi:carboxypeptidase regulatory-like domain-containing protein, partial [Chloroflexota bacterium]